MPSPKPPIPPPWETALDALLSAGWSKEDIAAHVGASWRTIHRMVQREPRRHSPAILRNVVQLAQTHQLLAVA